MNQSIKILRAIAFVALSLLLYFAMLFVFYLVVHKFSQTVKGFLDGAKWVGMTIVSLALGTMIFGSLAILISRINPYKDKTKWILLPFLLILVGYHWQHIYEGLFYGRYGVRLYVLPKVCLALSFVYMSVKVFLMLNRDPYRH